MLPYNLIIQIYLSQEQASTYSTHFLTKNITNLFLFFLINNTTLHVCAPLPNWGNANKATNIRQNIISPTAHKSSYIHYIYIGLHLVLMHEHLSFAFKKLYNNVYINCRTSVLVYSSGRTFLHRARND